MSLNVGPNLDMTTISGPDSDPNYQFMKEPEAVKFNLSEDYITQGQHMPFPEKNNIKELQEYFNQPTELLKQFLGELKYNGPIDGIINDELKEIANKLESVIAKDLKTTEVYGMVLATDPEDIEEALTHIIKEDLHVEAKLNRDQRLLSLAKMINR